jgi:hypothetical protein
MEELVRLVSEKAGLSEDMSQTAAHTVVGYLKDKLPAPVAGQIDALLAGGGGASQLGGLAKNLGGILGRKK